MLNPTIPDIHFLHMVCLIVTALGLVCMCVQYFSHCVCLYMCVTVLVIGMCLHVNPMIPDIHFLHMVYLIVPALGFVCTCFLYFSHCVCLFICVCLCKRCVYVHM
jgi:hypothetical protein